MDALLAFELGCSFDTAALTRMKSHILPGKLHVARFHKCVLLAFNILHRRILEAAISIA